MNATESSTPGKDGNLHRIDRLRFEISCSEEGQAFELRQSFAQTFQSDIAEIIDQVCSNHVFEHEWLRIDTVEIDLGRFSPHTLAYDFATVFREQFEKELAKKINAFTFEQREASKEHSRMELLSHFLLHGTLPWWSNEADVDMNVVIRELRADLPGPLCAFFNQQRANRMAWARAAFQLDDSAKSAIISLFKELQDVGTRLINYLEACKAYDIRFDKSDTSVESIRRSLLRRAPEIIGNRAHDEVIGYVINDIIKEMTPHWTEDMIQMLKAAIEQGQMSSPAAASEAVFPAAPGDKLSETTFGQTDDTIQMLKAAVEQRQMPEPATASDAVFPATLYDRLSETMLGRTDDMIQMLKATAELGQMSSPAAASEAVFPVALGDRASETILDRTDNMTRMLKEAVEQGEMPELKAAPKAVTDIRPSWIDRGDLSSDRGVEFVIAEHRYVVRHAGVILLAPFFRNFFDACGLMEGLDWKSKDAQYKAVHLLKYLTAGSKKTPEFSLTLEKLICGMAVEEPIPFDVGLQEHHLDEVQVLLASVIEHWKVLKNTSTDGLRETFLKRDGLITRKSDGWLLRVERKTLDVLLDSIPWGYSTITLPWNDYLIHVEW